MEYIGELEVAKRLNGIYFGLSPLPVTVANEGLGWDPQLKNVSNNPGGDWNPGRGDNPKFTGK